jgi:hypothetical protein
MHRQPRGAPCAVHTCFLTCSVRPYVNSVLCIYTLAVVEPISLVRPFMSYQLTQHKPTTQWSDTLGSQHQQMSQQYPPSQYQIATHQSWRLVCRNLVLSESCSIALRLCRLVAARCSYSLPHARNQYTLHIHRLSGVIRSITSTLTSPLNHPTMTPKSLPVISGTQLKRGSEHTPQRYWLHEDTSPHLTHQIPLQNSRISPITISNHLLPPLTQL